MLKAICQNGNRFSVPAHQIRGALAILLGHALLLFAQPSFSQETGPCQIFAKVRGASSQPAASLDGALALPTPAAFVLQGPTSSWCNIGSMEFDVSWPKDAPTNAQVLVFIQDWDFFWYQNLLRGSLVPGETTRFKVSFAPDSTEWKPQGHHGTWNFRAMMQPKEVGLRIFSESVYVGTCRIGNVTGIAPVAPGAPFIRKIRVNSDSVPRYSKYEVTFEAPDRYPDPFDQDQVSVWANFTGPDGTTARVDGYYGSDYYREKGVAGERVLPQGAPYWRVRFCPTNSGAYKCTLHIKDAFGAADSAPLKFEATPSKAPGFVRVSKQDSRYFEYDNGAYCFPIGHNIRSPFDDRMDQHFHWKTRWPEGSAAYSRYFPRMHENGEDIAEIWSAAWSFGLEWTPRMPGYHGIGQYNMIHAWDFDNVMAEAEKNGIKINFVIHNHGKFGQLDDAEWDLNPFNVKNGGYLTLPQEYFTDPRALTHFRKLARYIVSRWGYSPNIFAWELWSELDLTGSQHGNHMKPETVQWHKTMSTAVKEMDVNRHMITTHVCTDFTRVNKDIIALPDIDFAAVDAYHGNADPVFIVDLLRRTAEFSNPLGKPILVTEFGGSAFAQGVKHLDQTLHAALWSSPAIPLGSAPMFWWWQLIDEENFYPKFAALNRFMAGEDRRDSNMVPAVAELTILGTPAQNLTSVCLRSPEKALGWIFRKDYMSVEFDQTPETSGTSLTISGVTNGTFRIEFWDTITGKPISTTSPASTNGVLKADVPSFVRDIAFKVRALKLGN